jgi:hypothetical protein
MNDLKVISAALSTASLSQIHGDIRESRWAKITLSLSSLLGVIFVQLVPIPNILDNILVSIIAGIQKFRGHVTDFKTNRYMSPISGNESLDFKLVHK